VLVAPDGSVIASAPKLEAHQSPGSLHLAFSVFLYRPDGALLLQRRALGKYHFPGVWANACCSHPQPGDDLVGSAERRVKEELGVSCALREVGVFTYRATCVASGLVEHERDHVFVGRCDGALSPDPDEVAELAFVELARLTAALGAPRRTADGLGLEGHFAPWLRAALQVARPHLPGGAG
jgi:isopentenyl-diphosphate delta-isomerase